MKESKTALAVAQVIALFLLILLNNNKYLIVVESCLTVCKCWVIFHKNHWMAPQ